MIVSRWTPVIRSVERIELPSTSAPITASFFSFFSLFIPPISLKMVERSRLALDGARCKGRAGNYSTPLETPTSDVWRLSW